ncbi:MAG TPA: TonB-dependent receptor [Steroidobacter sp.]
MKHSALIPMVAVAMFASGEANSQTTTANAQSVFLLEEIVVTAQKREERLQDVPLAVTAVTGEMLGDQQIYDTNNLVKSVPSLTFQAGNNPSNNSFRIRGVGTSLFSLGVEPSVSVVVDGVVQARQSQNFSDLADIERVEVLRGPQGTLFGKNATAGVINVITARPSEEFQTDATLSIAQDEEYRATASVSGPLSDTLRVRVTGFYSDVGGYHTNAADGSDEGASESSGARVKLAWDAAETLDFLLAAEYLKTDADCCQYGLVSVQSPVRQGIYNAAGIPISADTDLTWNSFDSFANSEQKTFSLEGGLDLGFAKLVSISAYQDYSVDTNFEPDRLGTSVPVYLSPTSNALFDINYMSTATKQYSQELRLDSQGEGRVTYTVGGYYSNLDLDRDSSRRRALCSAGANVVGQPCAATTVSFQSLVSAADLKNEHLAAFGQVEVAVVGGLKLLGGLRVQHETLEVSGSQLGVLVAGDAPFGTIFPAGVTEASDDAVTGKAGAQYEFSRRAQVYATYTRGYKGQGADTEGTVNFSNNAVVQPEDVNAYEIGFKGSTEGGMLTVAVAAFLADYDNLQVQANRSDPASGVVTFQATNAGSSRTQGVELEATFRPVNHLNIAAGVTYLDPSLDANGLNCPSQFQSAAPLIAAGAVTPVNTCYRNAAAPNTRLQDVRDGETPATPHWRANLNPRFEMPVFGMLNGFVQVDASYQSEQNFAIEQDPNQVQEAYTLVDASIGVREINSRYSVTLFVKNLLDKNYYVTSQGSNLLPSNLNLVEKYAIRPKNADRYVGAAFGIKF